MSGLFYIAVSLVILVGVKNGFYEDYFLVFVYSVENDKRKFLHGRNRTANQCTIIRNRLEHEENDGNTEKENYFLFLSHTNYTVF